MTADEIKAMLNEQAAWINGSGPKPNLRGANLYGANLHGANLHGANLGGTLVVQIGPLGSRNDYLVVVRQGDVIEARAGCWTGSLDELERRVAEVHGDNQHGREYRDAIAYVRARLANSPVEVAPEPDSVAV